MLFGAWPIYFGPVGLNVSAIFLGLLVLIFSIARKKRGGQTPLFEVSWLLFLVGFLFLTFHGRLLQVIFPISLPERPLLDNNLTFNYALANLLAFLIFPVLMLRLMRSDVSLDTVGLRAVNLTKTTLYSSLGCILNVLFLWLGNTFFGYRWVSGHTLSGLVLWVLLVSALSVFSQTFFFIGILFNKYLSYENGLVLAAISIFAVQAFAYSMLPWVIINIIGSAVKITVTLRTRNIYGAACIGIVTNLVEISLQIL